MYSFRPVGVSGLRGPEVELAMPAEAKTTRVDDAYRRLKHEILENRMPPGFQAPEPEIADRLGMSRTPVREALIRLRSEGLVELIPRRGARVLPMSPDDMRDIYQILMALEPEAAAGVARRDLSPAETALLEQPTAEMERTIETGDLDAWAAADDRFHRALLDLNPNQRLSAVIKQLLDQAHRARMITLRLRKPPRKSTREHRAILTAILAHDATAARRLFHAHRERADDELIAILETCRLSSR